MPLQADYYNNLATVVGATGTTPEIKMTAHVDHISYCKTASGTTWLKRWTHRVLIICIRPDYISILSAGAPAGRLLLLRLLYPRYRSYRVLAP